MRAALVLAAVATGFAVSLPAAAEPSAATALRIAYWEDSSAARPDEVWTLRCNPPRGTAARPALACRRLVAGGIELFAPVPPDMACTEIYGGPQKALISGVALGRRVWTTLRRSDGCQIERWNRFVPWLLPPGGATT